jgi:hypothetical protein
LFSLQSEIDELKQRLYEVTEAKAQLEACHQKLLEESMYAKGLASAAGIELKALRRGHQTPEAQRKACERVGISKKFNSTRSKQRSKSF